MGRPQHRADAVLTGGRRGEIALALGSIVVFVLALGAIEVGLRVARPAALERTRVGHPHVYSETYGWALRPSTVFAGRSGERITVNADGYRGPAHAPAPRPGRRRVAMLGDSITFGSGVGDDATFSARLEALGRHEALNLGVDGYGTDQELLRLRHDVGRLGATDVVLNVCVRNDLFDNALPVALYDGVSRKPYFTLEDGRLIPHDRHLHLGAATRMAVALQERSHLLAALLRLAGSGTLAGAEGEDVAAGWDLRRDAVMRDFAGAVALTRRLVEEIARECADRRMGLLVVLHPDRRAFDGDDTLVAPFRDVAGIATVDLRAEYRGRGLRWDDLALDRIGHLSPRGHALVAEVVDARLPRP